jgi:hypothetical protein
MGRNYPRFVFSNPKNSKSEGPFIIHTMDPFIICRITDQPADIKTIHSRTVLTTPQHEYPLILLNDPKASNDIISNVLDRMKDWAKAQILSGDISF